MVNLNIKNYFVDEIKDNLYKIYLFSSHRRKEWNSNIGYQYEIVIGDKHMEVVSYDMTNYPKLLPILMETNVEKMIDNVKYCTKSRKTKVLSDYIKSGRHLYVIEGILFYKPRNSDCLYVCVDNNNKVWGAPELEVSNENRV